MRITLLASINLATLLLGFSFLGHAIAVAQWRRTGSATVILLIVLCGQLWLIPQAINVFAFHSTRLLYPLWFGNWIVSAFAVILFCLTLRGSSRELLDAARLDGSGFVAVYRHVVWPQLKRALAALSILLLMITWDQFAEPFLRTDNVGRAMNPDQLLLVLAISFLATVPVIGIYFLARRLFGSESGPTAHAD